jgi:hypothetical protein
LGDVYLSKARPLAPSTTRIGTRLLKAHVRAKYLAELSDSKNASLLK